MSWLLIVVGLAVVKVGWDTWRYERYHRARRRGLDSFEVAQRRAAEGEGTGQ